MKRTIVWAPFALLMVSCGGGGGASVSATPASTFRTNHVGDDWKFAVTIDFGIFGSYSGTLDESIVNDTYNGSASIKHVQVFNLVLQNGPATITSYQEFSPTGQLLAETVNGTLVGVTSNTFTMPSPLALNASSSGTVTLANGLTIAEDFSITGIAPVSTPAGGFRCWLAQQNTHRSDGTTDQAKLWFAPETGNYVQLVETTINPDGTGYTYNALLTSRPETRFRATAETFGPFSGTRFGSISPSVLSHIVRLGTLPRL